MKKITIGYSDVFPDFQPTDNIIYNILKQRYEVEILDTSIPENRDKIQYLIYSAAGNKYLDFHCIRIYVTGENLCPNFNLCDYAVGFEHMEFGDRFFRAPIYLWQQYYEDYALLHENRFKLAGKNADYDNTKSAAARKFCCVVASNNLFADPYRENFFNALSEYKRVDSGGRAYNNIGKPDGVEDKRAFLKDYKFNIAFENSSYPGYCTEKLMQAFSGGTVPIYWGDPTAVAQFNEKAFINCCGLTMEEAIAKVKEVDNNDELYLKMLSEPALADLDYREKTLQDMARWLYGIFDVDIETARRRPIHGKMAVYDDECTKRIRRDEKLRNNKITLTLARLLIRINKLVKKY